MFGLLELYYLFIIDKDVGVLSLAGRNFNKYNVFNSFLGSFLCIQFCKSIQNSKVLSFIGKNSLILLCIHELEETINLYGNIPFITNNSLFIIVRCLGDVILLIMLIFIINKIKLLKGAVALTNENS